MEKHRGSIISNPLGGVWCFLRKCLFSVLSLGPMPHHIAFIMDGNRRYAKRSLKQDSGHKVGFTALTSVLQYCFEMRVKYVTVYAFSIDNFKRQPSEVQSLMDLMKEKIDELLKEESIVNKYKVRINFWGNLCLLSEPVRLAAEKAMAITAGNMGPVFSVCVAYTSTNEIMHAVEESCVERRDKIRKGYSNGYKDELVRADKMDSVILVADLEQHFYTSDCPGPDIVIRTSGETRLSNFLLWQTTFSHLQNPAPLWPEFSFRHLVWAIIEYQRVYPYLERRRSSSKKED
ncbi:dehydrodolichyl diphosphate synthase CPT3 [Elaeis guineensis]|uniref:Alkyl transferase n=1 Tax=Elaeis guineensis var. tenera TaxID=51953 RepID=A0A6I9QD78_ELAGV|nr:dehydrodolichyl diphosphate synthase 6 [Elaeis guineensis]XP_010907460.1 dehydrodolichyl diphosphate synthase 6 [Elaeis guineensis]XP_029117342.1 dehydrodolichyl diphosphate synthase 6 [Elaeis guineensis]